MRCGSLDCYRALRDQISNRSIPTIFSKKDECDRLVFDKALVSYRLILSISFNASSKSSNASSKSSPSHFQNRQLSKILRNAPPESVAALQCPLSADSVAKVPRCCATNFPLKDETSGKPRSMSLQARRRSRL